MTQVEASPDITTAADIGEAVSDRADLDALAMSVKVAAAVIADALADLADAVRQTREASS